MLEDFVKEVNDSMNEAIDVLESSMDREEAEETLSLYTTNLLETMGKHLILTDRETEQTVDAELLNDLIYDGIDT